MTLDSCLIRFYRLFRIPKIKLDYPDNFDEFYPEITDGMYIELLALNIKYWRSDYVLANRNIKTLKAEILSDCCYMIDGMIKSPEKNKIIKKVQRILKGGLNERP